MLNLGDCFIRVSDHSFCILSLILSYCSLRRASKFMILMLKIIQQFMPSIIPETIGCGNSVLNSYCKKSFHICRETFNAIPVVILFMDVKIDIQNMDYTMQ